MQFMPDIAAGGYETVLQQVFEVAQDAGLPVTFTIDNRQSGEPIWPDAINLVEKYNADGRPPRSPLRCSRAQSVWSSGWSSAAIRS